MSRARLKREVLDLLSRFKPVLLYQQLDSYDTKQTIGPLFSALCNPSENVRWNAICAFGHMVPKLADDNMESGRVVMRRFLWSLNDESGGIGWGAPEAMAEIMCRHASLRGEYLHMLISYMREDGDELFQDGNFLELPMLQRGLLWGIGRLLEEHNKEMIDREVSADLTPYLASPDHCVVGLALRAISFLPGPTSLPVIENHLSSTKSLSFFTGERMVEVQLSDLARRALEKRAVNL